MPTTAAGQAALGIAMLISPMVHAADVLSTVPDSVERYARRIDTLTKAAGPVSLEPVFEEGVSAAAEVVAHLADFDEAAYRKVQSRMTGFSVGRDEILVAEPMAGFFLKLAREKGTATDQAFFAALQKTYPDGIWPAYIQPQTDYGGCRAFDGHTLTSLYGVWTAFQESYPYGYRRAALKERKAIEEAVTGDCPCGGEEEVVQELEAFSKAFPASPVAGQVAAQLQAVRNHTSSMRFHCQPR